jgi:hypothetical protein
LKDAYRCPQRRKHEYDGKIKKWKLIFILIRGNFFMHFSVLSDVLFSSASKYLIFLYESKSWCFGDGMLTRSLSALLSTKYETISLLWESESKNCFLSFQVYHGNIRILRRYYKIMFNEKKIWHFIFWEKISSLKDRYLMLWLLETLTGQQRLYDMGLVT